MNTQKTNIESASDILRKYQKIKMSESEERKVWLRSYQYVNNWVDGELGQWKSNIRKSIGDNPALSIPLVKKFINRLAGAQVSTALDEKAIPRDDQGDAVIAEILTDIKSYVYNLNNTDYQKARAFRDALITGRGFIKTCWNDELDPLGEITTKRINPFRIYISGDKEEYDLSRMDSVIEESFMSFDAICQHYPDTKEELISMKIELSENGSLNIDTGGYDYAPGESVSFDDEIHDKENGKYKILREQKYEYIPINFIDIPTRGLVQVSEKDIKQIQSQFGINIPVIRKKQKCIKETIICGNVILETSVGKYKHNKIDIVGWFAYNDNGFITGVAQDLLDIQDEKNKRRSQIIKILGTAAKNSFFAKKGALDDIEDAKKNISKTGSIIEVNGEPGQALYPIQSNLSILQPIASMESEAERDFNSVSGLTDASLGQVPEGVKSGRGINQLQQGVEIIISELFEHHLMSCKYLAQLTISLIQQYYTEPRRIRILGDYSKKFIPEKLQEAMQMGIVDAVEEGAKIIKINTDKLNDITIGRYDIVVDATSHNPTTRRAQYYDLLNMKAQGAPISWSKILSLSDIRGAEELSQAALEAERVMSQQAGVPPEAVSSNKTASVPKNSMPFDELINVAGAQTPM